METQNEYLDRICSAKPKKTKKPKKTDTIKTNALIFGYTWEEIQSMQQGTYERPLVQD